MPPVVKPHNKSSVCCLEGQMIAPDNNVDKWILSRLSNLVWRCDTTFKSYDLHFTTKALYQFWFSDFCDVYVEYTKRSLQSSDEAAVQATCDILHLCVDTFLRALSPFMPYLAEELFQRLPARGDNPPQSVCIAQYPEPKQYPWRDQQLDEELALVQETCTGIMSIIQGYSLPRKTAQVYVKVTPAMQPRLSHYTELFLVLTRLPCITMVTNDADIPSGSYPKMITPDVEVFIRVEGAIDFDAEIGRIEKRQKSVETKLEMLKKRADKFNANNNAVPEDLQDQMAQLNKELEQLESSAKTLRELSNR